MIALHLGVGIAVLTSVTILTALHDPITPLLAGIFGTLIGLAGGSATAAAALGSALNGKSTVDPGMIANQQQIIREGQQLIAAGTPVSQAAVERGRQLPDLPSSAPAGG